MKKKSQKQLISELVETVKILEARLIDAKDDRLRVKDLKERLFAAESANQQMRGYIARVQEDDVVREELVKTGDPDGELRLVPKRKPTMFFPPNNIVSDERVFSWAIGSFDSNYGEERPKLRHWVTY